ncbi:MAG: tetratricopeptide repeat protein [Hyphomicrobium sp.]
MSDVRPFTRRSRFGRRWAAWAILSAVGFAVGQTALAEERDMAREAVTNLEAYAEYKMGHYDAAREIWEGLAAKGNTTAMINLANLFQQGQGVTEDQKKATALVMQAAAAGDARAQYEIGIAYEKGHTVERNIKAAAGWLKKSAEQNYSDGQFAYGVMLATGYGKGLDKATAEERAQALDLLRKAKAGGNLEADDYIKVMEGAKG